MDGAARMQWRTTVVLHPAPLARSNGPVKRRFLQFSLRGLLGVAALVCLFLGGRHLLETYGNRLDVEEARVGVPIRVNARYFCLLGPAECILQIGYETADGLPLSDRTFGNSGVDRAERSWLCLYGLESERPPIDQPRQLIVYLKRHEKPAGTGASRVWTIKEGIVDVK